MKYGYIITRQDGTTEHGTITAINTAAAHTAMTATAAGYQYRVYPMCKELLALSIATNTAKNAVMRQGTETQYRIDRELRQLSAMTAAAMAAQPNMKKSEVTEYIIRRQPIVCGADSQDFISYAMEGIQRATAAGYDVRTATAAGYVVLNLYIYQLRTATEKELSTEYLQDGGGDIVSLGTAIACILYGGDKWTATAGGGLTAAQAADLGEAIYKAAALLRPAQRDIIRMLGNGYSQRQIAQKTGRALSTIEKNIAIIRGKMAAYIAEYYPEFVDLTTETTVNATAAQAAAAMWSNDGRTENGAARHAEQMKATQAARAAAYRARKRAAAQAAALLK